MISDLQLQEFKDDFAKIPDEPDSLIRSFLESAEKYVLRLTGLDELPTIVTGQDDNGDDIVDFIPAIKTAVFTRALFIHQERDFPRPGVCESTDKLILNLIAGQTDFSKRTVLTAPPEIT